MKRSDLPTMNREDAGKERMMGGRTSKLNESFTAAGGRKLATQAGRREEKRAYDQMYLMNTLYATYKEQGTKSKLNATRAS